MLIARSFVKMFLFGVSASVFDQKAERARIESWGGTSAEVSIPRKWP